MIKLEKGAKVKVRLHTGEVVEAVYYCPSEIKKCHIVWENKNLTRIGMVDGSRFIGNPCVHLPVGVSV